MYNYYISLFTFFIATNALLAFADNDLNFFDANGETENLFLDTIPTDEFVTTDASLATPNPDNLDSNLSPETQNDFLTASDDKCLSSSDIFSASSIFRTRSLPSKRRGYCFRPDGPEGPNLEIENLNIGEGVSEYWRPSALVPAIVGAVGGLPLIPVC